MSSFATLADVKAVTGKEFTAGEQDRINAILPLVSDALRVEGASAGVDLDTKMAEDAAYASLVKLVTIDIVMRAFRQSQDGEPMSQETQSALGYSWSGTYAIPGGGIAGAIMRNDLKRLGFKRQRYGAMEIWDGSME